MDIRNRSALKQAARQALSAAPYDPRKLILIHTGITAVLALLIAVLDFFLQNQIGNTAGLGGMGARSVLSTMQSVLTLVQVIALPFWQLGYQFATIRMARQQPAGPQTLLEGFRRFGALVRSALLQGLIYAAIGFISYYLCFQIYLMTPLAVPLYDLLLPMTQDTTILTTGLVLDEATMFAMLDAMLPALILWLVVFELLSLVAYYQLRMMNYLMLDDPGMGAFAALRTSRAMTRGSRNSLFKLDLSFWWFYALEFLLAVIAYGDVLLSLLGVTLPFSGTVGYFLFYILYLVGQLVLYLWCKNPVQVTYALAYDTLRQTPKEEPPSTPAPVTHPWKD